MLILTRRANESIVIDNDIEITILSTSANKVQIGIDAPKNIEVFRKEIWLRIQSKKNQARDENIDLLTGGDNQEVQQ
ncbi:MAG: carbon storage regulator CsrA [Gammaproteobacteria bacterium]|jgi:carbon storage regulator